MIALAMLLLAQAAQPDAPVRLQDEGVTKGFVDTLNCVGAGIACTRTGRKGTLTVTGGGGAGSPGGSSGQVQWNNAAAFDGMARVTTDGNDLRLTQQTTIPTAAAGKLTPLGYGVFGPGLPVNLIGDLGFALAPNLAPLDAAQAYGGCLLVAPGASTFPVSGLADRSSSGTATIFAWASTDVRTRAPWVNVASLGVANTSAFVRHTGLTMWRGSSAGLGGFWVHGAYGVAGTPPANQRAFFGLYGTAAGLPSAADPSAALDQVGFQCDAGQTTLRIGSNDNSGVATVTDLGANFPCTTTGIAYDWWLWTAPNASTINYAIREMVGGFTASGTLSTDLPRNTVQLAPQAWINTGSTAAAATMTFGPTCWVVNP